MELTPSRPRLVSVCCRGEFILVEHLAAGEEGEGSEGRDKRWTSLERWATLYSGTVEELEVSYRI
jgi:hypothetical protein